MTRRDCLIRMFGAAVAATLAPLVDLSDTTPNFWNQLPIKRLLPCRITFTDGTAWTFDANVVAEQLLDGGSFQFTLQPTGPMEISHTTPPVPFVEEGVPFEEIVETMPTVMTVDGGSPIEVNKIDLSDALNKIDLSDDNDSYVVGLQRTGTFVFTGKWK